MSTVMAEAEEIFQRARIEIALIDYWHDVDENWGRNAASYYTEDAIFGGDAASYKGREEIADFYAHRKERGERVAVHSVSNLRVKFADEKTANAHWYLFGYAGDGTPVLPTHPPIVIALIKDKYEKQADGKWLCAHRHFDVKFAGGTKPTNQKLDEQAAEGSA